MSEFTTQKLSNWNFVVDYQEDFLMDRYKSKEPHERFLCIAYESKISYWGDATEKRFITVDYHDAKLSTRRMKQLAEDLCFIKWLEP